MEIVLTVLEALGVVCVGILAIVGLQSLTRGTSVRRLRAPGDADGPPSPTDPLFCETLSLLTKTTLAPGHSIEVFANGNETYPRLWEDLRAAERSITLQMYYCQPGRMADEFKSILLERAAAAGARTSHLLIQGAVHAIAVRTPLGLRALPHAGRWTAAVESELRQLLGRLP